MALSNKGIYFLREIAPSHFQWFLEDTPTRVEATSTQEAIRLAYRTFCDQNFEPLLSGYKFTLPERDEHGAPALFIDMIRSLETPSGQYFDPLYGHNLVVHNIPKRARDLYLQLKQAGKL